MHAKQMDFANWLRDQATVVIVITFMSLALGQRPQAFAVPARGGESPPKEPPGSIFGRSGAARMRALIAGGGSKGSEAAVIRGWQWLKRHQESDGRWRLDGNFQDRGAPNDIAGTAFGLLPFLGAGKTHKEAADNDYDAAVAAGLKFLLNKQNVKTGSFGSGMYAHALATIVVAEAYGLTKDPKLQAPAQQAVKYIVDAQHQAGGWRYAPGQPGDTSVTGWQVMALVTAKMAGLDVPEATLRKVPRYLDSCCNLADEGYGYIGLGSTNTMTAVALLCRQYLQKWGPENIRLLKGIERNLKPIPPGESKNCYYHYYATQVMHHVGGEPWKAWNRSMRDLLVNTQDKSHSETQGSWPAQGDAHAQAGGRLMVTSLNLLTLEVYYRHLPLFGRISPQQKEAVPPLNPKWLKAADDFDGKPLPNYRGQTLNELKPAARDFLRLYNQAVVQAARTPSSAFALSAAKNKTLSFTELLKDTQKHRGKVVSIVGRVRRVERYEAPRAVRDEGIDRVYEAWVFGSDKNSPPLCLILTALPEGLKPGEQLNQRVEFAGYLIYRYRYISGRGPRETLLFIGPTVRLISGPNP